MAKTVQAPKHPNVVRDDLLTVCALARKREPIRHRKYGLYRLHIAPNQAAALPRTWAS